MKITILPILLLFAFANSINSQTNIVSTNPTAEAVLLGNYDVNDYLPSVVIDQKEDIVSHIQNNVSAESLKSYLLEMNVYETRNTGSDTVSNNGIGAARRWVYEKFQEISAANENRLIPSYLQFDQDICGMGQHRNVFAVLPGTSEEKDGIILIEAHMDSRCHSVCDVECIAHGMEDNGSGTALVIELARVMSQLSLERTVVFMATTGEEQGLYGANAFAQWAADINMDIRAVLNNDIVGGIICGETSSEPSCPGLDHVDSTQVRMFSRSNVSLNKQLCRFIKLEYHEELLDLVSVPMLLTIMSAEDRTGRGGDHIPFRERGFPAMRFTSANEHGNANASDPDYHDRQHTEDDILGVDTDGDSVLDSFFVDFNYLSRNAGINGNAAAMAAIGPVTPSFEAFKFEDTVYVNIEDPLDYGEYRVFLRSSSNDFDTIITVTDLNTKHTFGVPVPLVSVASVDEEGVESLFTMEEQLFFDVNSTEEKTVKPESKKDIVLLQNRPNPFDESTMISFHVEKMPQNREAFVRIGDMNGKEILRIPVTLKLGMNDVLYDHGYKKTGVFAYSLVVDGKVVDTKRMVFAN